MTRPRVPSSVDVPPAAPRAGGTTCGLPRQDRVRRRSEYRRIQSKGARVHTRHLLVLLDGGQPGCRRLGVTVTKKVGCAVERNHVKRRLKEVFRQHRSLFPEGSDVVVIAKRGAPTLSYGELLAELTRARHPMRKAYARHTSADSTSAQRTPRGDQPRGNES